MLAWSLEALAGAGSVAAVTVAAPPGNEGKVDEIASSLEVSVQVVTGGQTRGESVARAIEGIEGDGLEVIVVHDAARPLIAAGDVDALIEELLERPDADGVIAAAPISDTVKRAREPRPEKGDFPRGGPTVAKTESREHLWRAETPQVFRRAVLEQALKEAGSQRLRAATDESFLLEKAGGKVLMREVSGPNLKVTTPDDLRLAELLLRKAGGS
jgi:2-C-methyl-D-erythritol 4-phosphate cytidylyltransferase